MIHPPSDIDMPPLRAEPTYNGGPSYCALRFGPSPRSSVWLALDDDAMYVDRHATADLVSSDARVVLPAARYGVPIDLGEVYPAELPQPVRLKLHQFLIGRERTLYLHAWFAEGKREGASPVWSGTPDSAPVVFFYGRLTFALSDPTLCFACGGEPSKLEVMLGRPGVGERAFAWRNHSDIPRHLHPQAKIRLPASGSPRVEQLSLDERCCGCRFHNFLSLGQEISVGTARIDVTFDTWPTGGIQPARFEVECK